MVYYLTLRGKEKPRLKLYTNLGQGFEFVKDVENDDRLSRYYAVMKMVIQPKVLGVVEKTHDGSMVLKATRELNSPTVRIANLPIKEFCDIEQYIDKKYKGIRKEVEKSKEEELLTLGEQMVSEFNRTGASERFKQSVVAFKKALDNYVEGLSLKKRLSITKEFTIKSLGECIDSIKEGKMSPVEFQNIQKEMIRKKREALIQEFAPKPISIEDVLKGRVTWADIKARERYERRERLKNFLEKYGEKKEEPRQEMRKLVWDVPPKKKLKEGMDKVSIA